MTSGEKTLLISTPEQLRALRTPLRQEIVRTLVGEGSCTVRELAEALGREPAALYYHVHALVDAGIATEGGTRGAGGRAERVYSPVAPRIVIDRRKNSRAFLSALADLQRATLRATERELESAIKSRGTRNADDSTSLLRLTARLRPRDAERAAKMLSEVATFLAESDDPDAGKPYSMTAALARLSS
jgi:DNA-binding transcriptional ArsR family regulator